MPIVELLKSRSKKISRFSDNSVAVLVPGQGCHEPGMGKDSYEKSEIGRYIFDTASRVNDVDLPQVCWGGDNIRLNETIVAQPAIASVVMAKYFQLHEKGFNPDVGEGHSAGEIALLGMAKVLTIEDTFTVIKARAEAMLHAHTKRPGKMAVAKTTKDQARQSIAHLLDSGRIFLTNFNSKTQQVISGDEDLVDKAKEIWRSLKIRAIDLPIQIAAHSAYHMHHGVAPFEGRLNEVKFKAPQFDIMLNNVKYLSEIGTDSLKKYLKGQLVKGVDFAGGTERLYVDGIRRFYDPGPRPTLSRLVLDDYEDSVSILSEEQILKEASKTLYKPLEKTL